ncbi:exodeoxyribonuclease VII small subunit [Candidatus Saccharibacteria bacterium]|nr:exodeoxyribonuclease VII small subunit [Candidatus Saccharibacteria bacterium]
MANKSYRELKGQLDEVLARLQQDDIDIDEAMKLHEQGTKLVAELETYLKTAENKITKHKRA